jgi:hypothetical protein
MGQTQSFRMRVTEPEPGRMMTETDLDTGLVTQFIVEPRDNGQSEVTITTTFQPSPGLKGWLERITAPGLMRRTYRQELQKLDDYAQHNL